MSLAQTNIAKIWLSFSCTLWAVQGSRARALRQNVQPPSFFLRRIGITRCFSLFDRHGFPQLSFGFLPFGVSFLFSLCSFRCLLNTSLGCWLYRIEEIVWQPHAFFWKHAWTMNRKFWLIDFRSYTDCSLFTFCISIPNNHRHEIFRRWLSLVKLLTLFCRKCRQLFQYVSCWVSILWSVLCRVLYAHPLRPHFLDLFETFWSYLIILIFIEKQENKVKLSKAQTCYHN